MLQAVYKVIATVAKHTETPDIIFEHFSRDSDNLVFIDSFYALWHQVIVVDHAIKEITPCADCGLTFPAVCMDFDHVRGDKVDNVSYLVSGHRRWEIIETEIAKCEIVCSNCHRVRTLNKKRGQ